MLTLQIKFGRGIEVGKYFGPHAKQLAEALLLLTVSLKGKVSLADFKIDTTDLFHFILWDLVYDLYLRSFA